MRSLITLLVSMAVSSGAANAQDRHDWQSLAHLKTGDHIRLSLKTGPVDGVFQSWTAQDLTMGSTTTKREEVLRIERYRPGAKNGRLKHALIGALIGFGAGFGIGEGVGRCKTGQLCVVSGNEVGLVGAGIGTVAGAGIGALFPGRNAKETIYSVK